MVSEAAAARSVPGTRLHQIIKDLGVTHVVTVPDTHQRTLMTALFEYPDIQVITVSTEDEAIGINAGLYMGGKKPMMLVQQLGVFASMNAMRGIALDMNVPTFILAGMFGRDVSKTVEDNPGRGVRLVGPMLDAVGVPNYLVESEDDLDVVAKGYAEAHESHGPVVILIGAPTS